MSRVSSLVVCLPLVLSASGCGLVNGEGAPAPASTPRQDPPRTSPVPPAIENPAPTTIVGSFDVRFVTATVEQPTSGPQNFGKAPSLSTSLRVDLREPTEGTFEAVVTPRWGEPVAFAVARDAKGFRLTNASGASVQGTGNGVSLTDSWREIVLPIRNDALSGECSAQGEQTAFMGDAGYSNELEGTCIIGTDKTSPETRIVASSSLGPKDMLLPWDSIRFELAEPLIESAAMAGASLKAKGTSPALAWDTRGPKVTDWAGVTLVEARAKRWSDARGPFSADLIGLVDRAELWSAPSHRAIEYVPLGGAMSTIGFDDDIMEGYTWGDTTLLGGGEAGDTDARCEAGGCLRITMPESSACDTKLGGLAALLNRGPNDVVKVRYRVLVQPTTNVDATPYVQAGFDLQVAAEDGARVASSARVGSGAVAVTKLDTPVDGYAWGTTWSTLEVAAPSGNAGLGIAIAARGSGYCYGPSMPPVKAALFIEKIESL